MATNDLFSTYAYDAFRFANSRGLPLFDALMMIDVQNSLLIQASYKEGQAPTDKQLEFYEQANRMFGLTLHQDPDNREDRVFTLDAIDTLKKRPESFFRGEKISFITLRLNRYRRFKPELFDFVDEVNREINERKNPKAA